MEKLKLIPATAGCIGCFYEDKDVCPAEADGKTNLNVCSDERQALIFVRDE